MLNFQLFSIKESPFPKKEMVAEVLGSFFFCLPLVHCKMYIILSTTHALDCAVGASCQ